MAQIQQKKEEQQQEPNLGLANMAMNSAARAIAPLSQVVPVTTLIGPQGVADVQEAAKTGYGVAKKGAAAVADAAGEAGNQIAANYQAGSKDYGVVGGLGNVVIGGANQLGSKIGGATYDVLNGSEPPLGVSQNKTAAAAPQAPLAPVVTPVLTGQQAVVDSAKAAQQPAVVPQQGVSGTPTILQPESGRVKLPGGLDVSAAEYQKRKAQGMSDEGIASIRHNALASPHVIPWNNPMTARNMQDFTPDYIKAVSEFGKNKEGSLIEQEKLAAQVQQANAELAQKEKLSPRFTLADDGTPFQTEGIGLAEYNQKRPKTNDTQAAWIDFYDPNTSPKLQAALAERLKTEDPKGWLDYLKKQAG